MNLLTLTQILTGLSAGFFFAWSVTVIPGTKEISDKSYLETMKSINKKIMNPVFFILFFGPVPLLIYNAINLDPMNIAATITYLLGPIGITMTKNVPLNDKLDAQELSQLSSEGKKAFRQMYEPVWNKWHFVRTIFSIVSLILILTN